MTSPSFYANCKPVNELEIISWIAFRFKKLISFDVHYKVNVSPVVYPLFHVWSSQPDDTKEERFEHSYLHQYVVESQRKAKQSTAAPWGAAA